MMKLQDLRENIDQINHELVRLLIQRKNISYEIGKIKKDMKIPIYDPSREKSIYDSLKSKYPNEYQYLIPIFEIIIQESRKSQ
jgi:chorismate mutase